MRSSAPGTLRSTSVSSMRITKSPPWWRAKSQLKTAMRTFPRWSDPVGLGAKRVRMRVIGGLSSKDLVLENRWAGPCARSAAQVRADAERERLVQARHPGNLLGRSIANLAHRTESGKEGVLPRRPDARNLRELAANRALLSELAVVRDREAMRLVPHPLEQVQGAIT